MWDQDGIKYRITGKSDRKLGKKEGGERKRERL